MREHKSIYIKKVLFLNVEIDMNEESSVTLSKEICKHVKQGWSLFRHFFLTFLLVGFSYGATLTHCTRLHFTNYRITDVTSALMREDIVRLSIISNMFKIIVKQFGKASTHFTEQWWQHLLKNRKSKLLTTLCQGPMPGIFACVMPSCVEEVSVYEELDTVSVRCSMTWSENLKGNRKW